HHDSDGVDRNDALPRIQCCRTQHERWIGHRFTWQHYGRTWWTSARLWLWATTALLPGFVSLFLWNPAIVRCLTFALTGRGERMRAGGPVGRVVQRFAWPHALPTTQRVSLGIRRTPAAS